MQQSNTAAARSPFKAAGIDSKISTSEGAKGAGLGLGGDVERKGDAIVGGKGSVKGFAGGVIDAKVKC